MAEVSIELPIPPGVLDALARTIAEHVAAQSALEPSRWLNVESAADYLDTTTQALRGLVKREHENGFPVHRRGGRLLFDRRELDAWVRGGQVAHRHPSGPDADRGEEGPARATEQGRQRPGGRTLSSHGLDSLDATGSPSGRPGCRAAQRPQGEAREPHHGTDKGERPRIRQAEVEVLDKQAVDVLLSKAPDALYKTLFATVEQAGLRQSEALGLRWESVDFDGGFLRVRSQLSRGAKGTQRLVELKGGDKRRRDVVLSDELAAVLKEHRKAQLASGRYRPDAYVFCDPFGYPLLQRQASEKIKDAGCNGYHVLRHTYASRLIARGLDVVSVQTQLGHASPAITLNVYAHQFRNAEHSERIRAAVNQ
jgi:integrase